MSHFPDNLRLPQIRQGGLSFSRLGLGTVKFGRNTGVKYPDAFALPDLKTLSHLLAYAQSLGVNLLDTAPAYGESESRLGQLLQGQREAWVLVGKAGERFEQGVSQFDFSRKAVIESVEQSLKRLKTDYLDLLLIHSDGQDLKIFKENEISVTVQDLKASGKIRLGGMSTKTVEGGLLAIEYLDAVMCCYRPGYEDERPVLERAHQRNKIALLKKVLDSGHQVAAVKMQKGPVNDPIAHAMTFAFNHPGVSSVIVGTLDPEHLRHDAACVQEALSSISAKHP